MQMTIGIDPGKSVGIAVFRGTHLIAAEQLNRTAAMKVLRTTISRNSNIQIACERFTITRRTARHSAQPAPLEVIGEIRSLCEQHSIPLVLQGPSEAKLMFPNTRLRKLGLLQKRKADQPDANDVNDAIRHALVLIAKRQPADLTDILTPDRMPV